LVVGQRNCAIRRHGGADLHITYHQMLRCSSSPVAHFQVLRSMNSIRVRVRRFTSGSKYYVSFPCFELTSMRSLRRVMTTIVGYLWCTATSYDVILDKMKVLNPEPHAPTSFPSEACHERLTFAVLGTPSQPPNLTGMLSCRQRCSLKGYLFMFSSSRFKSPHDRRV